MLEKKMLECGQYIHCGKEKQLIINFRKIKKTKLEILNKVHIKNRGQKLFFFAIEQSRFNEIT